MSWWRIGGISSGLEGVRASSHDLRNDALQIYIRNDESTRTRLHRALGRLDIRVLCALCPCCINFQHRLYAVSVLLGDPQWILANHQAPTDRGVSRVVWLAIACLHCMQRALPSYP